MMTRLLALCFVLTLLVLTVSGAAPAEDVAVATFSALEPGGIPAGWKSLRFPSVDQATDYSLLEEDGRVVLRATSQASASALVKELTVDPDQHPYLTWSWKTGKDCFAGNWQQAEADDFPLRLFVLFEGSGGFFSIFRKLGSRFSGDALLYLADSQHHEEKEQASHLSGRIKIVPLAGPQRDGLGWDRLVRNVRADYVDLFGHAPKRVTAVALMTDTDNSATQCVSYFGDIYFSEEGQ